MAGEQAIGVALYYRLACTMIELRRMGVEQSVNEEGGIGGAGWHLPAAAILT